MSQVELTSSNKPDSFSSEEENKILKTFKSNINLLPTESKQAAENLHNVLSTEFDIQLKKGQSVADLQTGPFGRLVSEIDTWLIAVSKENTPQKIEKITKNFKYKADELINRLESPLSRKQQIVKAIITVIGAVLGAVAGFALGGAGAIPGAVAGAALGGTVSNALAEIAIGFFSHKDRNIDNKVNQLIESKLRSPELLKQKLKELNTKISSLLPKQEEATELYEAQMYELPNKSIFKSIFGRIFGPDKIKESGDLESTLGNLKQYQTTLDKKYLNEKKPNFNQEKAISLIKHIEQDIKKVEKLLFRQSSLGQEDNYSAPAVSGFTK
ncbi:MAG: DUF6861 domain-containing protein [Gammaproteobacteria bacterium]